MTRETTKFLALLLAVFGASCLFATCLFLPGCGGEVDPRPPLRFPFVVDLDGGRDGEADASDPPPAEPCPPDVGEGEPCPAAIELVCRDGQCVVP